MNTFVLTDLGCATDQTKQPSLTAPADTEDAKGRSGLANLNSDSRSDKWTTLRFQAASASGSDSKYTASGVRRSSALCGRRVL